MILVFCSAVPIMSLYQKFRGDLAAAIFGLYCMILMVVSWAVMTTEYIEVSNIVSSGPARRLKVSEEGEEAAHKFYGLDGYESYDSRHKIIGRATFWVCQGVFAFGILVSILRLFFKGNGIKNLALMHYLSFVMIMFLGPVCCYTGAEYITANENMLRGPGVWLAPSCVALIIVFLREVWNWMTVKKAQPADRQRA